ncbi:MAG: S8 family peptidase [Gemmatimonadaceae bacterium]
MQIVLRSLHLTRLTAALGAAMLGGGCASSQHVVSSAPVVSFAGASAGASVERTVLTAYVESQTASFALDRIDQRTLPLDRTYRHYGSGRGVTVYVFDGGILDTHPELEGRVRRGFNAFPDEDHLCNAHGTAVAGAVAGKTLGVAPEAEIVDVKMVECRKLRGTIDAIVRGADWVLADHAKHPGTRAVANWSFIADTSQAIPALDSAVRRLLDAGIPVIVSAGNVEMNACHISPGNSPGVIVVGASRVRRSRTGTGTDTVLVDERAPNTAFGPCIDVFAPGDSVLLPSMDVRMHPSEQLWTGTSMSAGYVSGAVALFLEARPTATTTAVYEHIMANSSRVAVLDKRSPVGGLLFVGPEERRIASR